MTSLDELVRDIAASRNALHGLSYDDPKYDDMEEHMHHLEDNLQDQYGIALIKTFKHIHDQHCPDTVVMNPIAYMARSYKVNGTNEYEVGYAEGVEVKAKAFPGKKARLVILPNPTRVFLTINKQKQLEVWRNTPDESKP